MTHHEYIVGDGVHEVVFGKYQLFLDHTHMYYMKDLLINFMSPY